MCRRFFSPMTTSQHPGLSSADLLPCSLFFVNMLLYFYGFLFRSILYSQWEESFWVLSGDTLSIFTSVSAAQAGTLSARSRSRHRLGMGVGPIWHGGLPQRRVSRRHLWQLARYHCRRPAMKFSGNKTGVICIVQGPTQLLAPLNTCNFLRQQRPAWSTAGRRDTAAVTSSLQEQV